MSNCTSLSKIQKVVSFTHFWLKNYPHQSIHSRCAKCQIHIWHTKHKNGALLDVLNLKNYATLLQYHRKYETVWITIAKSNIIFIAFFSLLFHRYLSLHRLYLISFLSVTLYLFHLVLAQESCSRSLSSPCRQSCHLTF